ncbi:MAG: cation:proton antiporter [Proteobacteria bacterium]|nr:cation:proton antiporter [Pseudomonadota bacterium]HQR04572.1 monovalent cation:proton antiporter-2 (CPA2) family protein [Rhodocyclaceae bacterium]
MYQNLLQLLLLLSAAVGAVAAARRLKFPSMLAYLAVGIVIGPHGLRLLSENKSVESVAEFGVVFLMFSIGLEFSLASLGRMRRIVFGYGTAQVALTTLGTILITLYGYGQHWRTGMAVGLAVAMSSTAIVAKLLSDRFELHSRSGRLTMGVLLFQDLALVPVLLLLPALASPDEGIWRPLMLALLQASLVLVILIAVGKRLMARIYDSVAHHKSEELFVLATLWIVVGLAYATGRAGLSLALGAFVGGMLISETAYRHQVEADIRPFRDILLGLFFVTIGMTLDLGYVLSNLDRLLLAVGLLVAGKALVVMIITLTRGIPLDVALRTAGQLAQAGEFGLVLMEVGHNLKLMNDEVFQVTTAAMLSSMFLAPSLIGLAARSGQRLTRGRWSHPKPRMDAIHAGSEPLSGHVILCGYGRTGERIGSFLAREDIPFLALDLDPNRASLRPVGGTVMFGNADRVEVIAAAGLDRARAVVITYPDVHSSLRILRRIRQQRGDIPVITRVPDESEVDRLKRAGATEVVSDVLEGSLMMAVETLTHMGIPVIRAIGQVREVRAERYSNLRDYYRQPLVSEKIPADTSGE